MQSNKRVANIGDEVYAFICPGCNDLHCLPTKNSNYPGYKWGFNFNLERPTFTPSILVTCGHYVPRYNSDKCWCTFQKERPEVKGAPSCYLCHSFVTDGKIQFLTDCTHNLKGQTIELPLISEEKFPYCSNTQEH